MTKTKQEKICNLPSNQESTNETHNEMPYPPHQIDSIRCSQDAKQQVTSHTAKGRVRPPWKAVWQYLRTGDRRYTQ